MEVTCEHCKAEYDFDDSLVGESGTSVKCTDCGHVFKVYPSITGASRGRLQLRFRDGHIELLSSLRELQRRARDGEVTLDDEIGREGFEWRSLRTVPELRGFFEAGGRGPGATTKPLGGGLAVTPSLRPGEPSSSPPPRPAPAKQTMLGMGPGGAAAGAIPAPTAPPAHATAGAAPRALGSQPAPNPAAAAPGAPSSQPAPNPAAAAARAPSGSGPKPVAAAPRTPSGSGAKPPTQAGAKPPAARAPRAPSGSGPKLFLAEDDEAELPAARRSVGSGSLRWIGLGVLVAGGVWFAVNAFGNGGLMGESLGFAGGTVQGTSDAPADEGEGEGDAEAAAAPSVQAPPEAATAPTVEPLKDEAEAPEARPQAEKPAKQAKAEARAARAKKEEREPRAHRGRQRDEGDDDASGRGDDEEEGEADYGTLVGRAGRAMDRDDLAKAQSLYERALELRGSGSEANSGLGFALLAQGKASASLPYLHQAARNGFAVANVGLGDAYLRMGRKAEAREAYETYLRRLPSGNRAAYARSQVERLGESQGADEAPAAAPEPAPSAPEPPPTPAAAPPEESPQPEEEGDDYVPAGALL